MNVVIIDNYDSFTYNLYQFVGECLAEQQRRGLVGAFRIHVKRNDEVSLEALHALAPERIIISPGPGSPEDARYFGICAEVIRVFGQTTPLLGVCLGMQGIAHVFGGRVVKAPLPVHGKISPISHNGEGLFRQLPEQVEVMRYHSLVAEHTSLPSCLRITAAVVAPSDTSITESNHLGGGEIMAIEHCDYPIYGIQFHPESFATECGKEMLANFLGY